MGAKTKSPLKWSPLRVAGQSADEQLDRIFTDKVVSVYLVAVLFVAIAAFEWLREIQNSPPLPRLFTVFAVIAVGWAVIQIRRYKNRAHNLKLGRDGERAVAQYLEQFRTKDFFVFHDVPQGNSNIDHVLIGTRGIYTIETKTLSKPVRGDCKIVVDKGKVTVNGKELNRDPITQAKAQARWLYDFLAGSQFKQFVQPVVVFPGWFVEPHDRKALGVWVLEPKMLDGILEEKPEILSFDQVRAMASTLSSYIRSQSALMQKAVG